MKKLTLVLLLLIVTAFGRKLYAQPMGGKTGASDWHTLPPIQKPTPGPTPKPAPKPTPIKMPTPGPTPKPAPTPPPMPTPPPPGQWPTKH